MVRTLFVIFLLFAAAPAFAQNINFSIQTLREYNRIQPLQNPDYEKMEKVLGSRILDTKNHVVGEVGDVVLASNGSINSLKVEFDRLQFNTPVYVNYRTMKIQSVTNGYQMAFSDDELTQIYPSLLANIESASGPGTDNISLLKLKGTQVIAEDGRIIGTVDDVLFASAGNRAQALYIDMSYGVLNNQPIAIPFRSGVFKDDGMKLSLAVPNDFADAMIAYATNK